MVTRNYYLYTPWERELIDHAKKVKRSVDLVCPFIKLPIMKKILAVLPEDNRIRIRILTRFSTQVFTQGSSDLSVFDVMVNYASKKYDVTVHRLDNVHAKIFVFDEEEMFLTSSNLSYAGLNLNFEIAVRVSNLDEVGDVRSTIESFFSEETLINSEDVKNMSQGLKARTQSLIQSGQIQEIALEPAEAPTPVVQDSILSDYQEVVEEISDSIEAAKQTRTLEEINEFLAERGVAEYNQIEGKGFESVRRPFIKRDEVSEQDFADFCDHWNNKALRDEELLTEYLNRVFGRMLCSNSDKLEDAQTVFLHNSWKNVYRTDLLDDYRADLFVSLGKALHECLVARDLVEKRLFSEERIHKYSTSLHYIVSNYPYGSVLSDIGCRFLLHMGDLSPGTVDRVIYCGLMGSLVTCLPFEQFCKLYKGVLSRLDDFVYDDYSTFDSKSYLQDISQKHYGLPEYRVVSESGAQHKKVYEVVVSLKEMEVGRGFGGSIHAAEGEAAFQAIKNLPATMDLRSEERKPRSIRLKKYEISESQ